MNSEGGSLRAQAARAAVERAKTAGVLPRAPQFCCVCGRPGQVSRRGGSWSVVLHHHDYAQPLNVSAVCWWCHRAIHAGRIPEPATGVLRSASEHRAGDAWRHPGRMVLEFHGIPAKTTQRARWEWAAAFVAEHGLPPDPPLPGQPITGARRAWFDGPYKLVPRSWAEVGL